MEDCPAPANTADSTEIICVVIHFYVCSTISHALCNSSKTRRSFAKNLADTRPRIRLDSLARRSRRPSGSRSKLSPPKEARHYRPRKIFVRYCRPWIEQKALERLREVKPVLLDTGVIVALLDRSEKFHDACAAAVRDLHDPMITCEAVLAESCYLLRNLSGAAEAVIENVTAGIFQIPFQMSTEANNMKALLRKYRDRRIDLADACLIRLADEFQTGDILTVDKDFTIYRWGKKKPFRILLDLK